MIGEIDAFLRQPVKGGSQIFPDDDRRQRFTQDQNQILSFKDAGIVVDRLLIGILFQILSDELFWRNLADRLRQQRLTGVTKRIGVETKLFRRSDLVVQALIKIGFAFRFQSLTVQR